MREETQTGLIETFGSTAAVYDRNNVQFFQPIGRRLVELAAPKPGGRALDVGCGRGAVLYPLADAIGANGSVIGIDLTPEMVAETSAEAAERGNVEVREMDGAAPEFPPADFDVITGSMSIIMIPDLPTVFTNYARLLRPGGRLAFSCPVITATEPVWSLGPFSIGDMARAVVDAAGGQDSAVEGFVEAMHGLSDDIVSADLRAAGFAEVRIVEEPVTITASSVDELLDWSWTHGMRMFWERMDEQTRAAQRAAIAERAAEYVQPDGSVSFTEPIRYLLADTPSN